jgi:MerR family transcriptional regulator, redox-sensitive transcriptional activator SoxR
MAIRGSEELTIGQVAKQLGVRTSKIRYYETVGLLSAPSRVSGRRVYERDTMDTLRLIQFAQDAGFTIAEIRHVLRGFDRDTPASARWQKVARAKLEDVARLIERAEQMQHILESLLSCECVQLSECARQCRPPASVSSSTGRRAI